MQAKQALLRCLVWCAVLSPCWAFWDLPHMTVAEIAKRSLTVDTKSRVDKVLSTLAPFFPSMSNLVTCATWPDHLKTTAFPLFNHWHYYDQAYVLDGLPEVSPPPTNALWALKHCEYDLSSYSGEVWGRSVQLRLLVHIVGDVHQPLHTITRVNAQFPDGDMGGNLFHVTDPTNSAVHNLHSFWDWGGGAFDEYSGALLSAAGTAFVGTQADKVLSLFPPDSFSPEEVGANYSTWMAEGYRIGVDTVYNAIQPGDTISEEYRTKAQSVVLRQVALAGLRLAHVLNRIFETDSGPELSTVSSAVSVSCASSVSALVFAILATLLALGALLVALHGYFNRRRSLRVSPSEEAMELPQLQNERNSQKDHLLSSAV